MPTTSNGLVSQKIEHAGSSVYAFAMAYGLDADNFFLRVSDMGKTFAVGLSAHFPPRILDCLTVT